MKQNTFIHSIARAALTLTLALLTTMTAWATSINYINASGTSSSADATLITSETTELGVADTETWYYVSGTVTNENRLEVSGTVNIILVDDGRLNANSGIHLTEGNTLNIWAQSASSGYLYAKSIWQDGRWCNAIGGNGGENSYLKDIAGDDGENAGDLNLYRQS